MTLTEANAIKPRWLQVESISGDSLVLVDRIGAELPAKGDLLIVAAPIGAPVDYPEMILVLDVSPPTLRVSRSINGKFTEILPGGWICNLNT